MAIESITNLDLRSIISQELDEEVVTGTATGGTATTIVDSVNLTFVDNALKDALVFINAGPGIGDERVITANSLSSTNLTAAAFSATPTTSSVYEIHSRYHVARINRAINSGIRRFRWALVHPTVKTTILTNNNLLNGLFSEWTSDSADSWTKSGNNYTQNVVHISDEVSGGSMTRVALVYSTSTDVKLEATDGTTTVSDSHDGSGWNLLSVSLTSVDSATAVAIRLTVDGASSVLDSQSTVNVVRGDFSSQVTWDTGEVAYVDSVFSPRGISVHKYALPNTLRSIHEITLDRSVGQVNVTIGGRGRTEILDPKTWRGRVGGDNPARYIDFQGWTPDDNTAVTFHGMAVVSIPTADTDVLEGNIAPIQDWACYELLRRADITEAASYRRDAFDAVRELRVAWPPNSYIFDPN